MLRQIRVDAIAGATSTELQKIRKACLAAKGFNRMEQSDALRFYAAIRTYSKSPGLLSMPIFGGAIQLANCPASYCGRISDAMKSPSAREGSHSSLRFFQ